jgi:hypothetical protein
VEKRAVEEEALMGRVEDNCRGLIGRCCSRCSSHCCYILATAHRRRRAARGRGMTRVEMYHGILCKTKLNKSSLPRPFH